MHSANDPALMGVCAQLIWASYRRASLLERIRSLLCMCSVSCSLDTGLQQCAVYRVQSAYILPVSRYGDNGLQQRSVYVTPGRLEVWRRHRLKLASMHAQRE